MSLGDSSKAQRPSRHAPRHPRPILYVPWDLVAASAARAAHALHMVPGRDALLRPSGRLRSTRPSFFTFHSSASPRRTTVGRRAVAAGPARSVRDGRGPRGIRHIPGEGKGLNNSCGHVSTGLTGRPHSRWDVLCVWWQRSQRGSLLSCVSFPSTWTSIPVSCPCSAGRREVFELRS